MFGVYVHIPYCLQRCPYCDFSTYEIGQILGPDSYVEHLKKEIQVRTPSLLKSNPARREIDTIYFGGGTPSLIEPQLIVSILREFEKQGFVFSPSIEITLEINPATISEKSLEIYLKNGINRFSVGAQTFDDRLLKIAGRKHNAKDTIATLDLLKSKGLNYTMDLLFALPSQTVEDLRKDLKIIRDLAPNHVSAYCLTVPPNNPLYKGRAPDEEQRDMFFLIQDELYRLGLARYEISNFAKPGFSSRHNSIYWSDEEYIGFGVSSHSYLKGSPWGERFWNPKSIGDYLQQIETEIKRTGNLESPYDALPEANLEVLKKHEALTDYCHVRLRTSEGLKENDLLKKFDQNTAGLVVSRLEAPIKNGLVKENNRAWALSDEGWLISNQVYQHLTFLPSELPH